MAELHQEVHHAQCWQEPQTVWLINWLS